MAETRISPQKKFQIPEGSLRIPGDKSISHRAVMFGGLSLGTTEIRGLLEGADVLSTVGCFKSLGVQTEKKKDLYIVRGVGKNQLAAPLESLDCGNSGTTMRLMMGILSGQKFKSTLFGDASLSQRPMGRVAEPLRQMGANITLREGRFAPVEIEGHPLIGQKIDLKVASAQVKSAILLAGLYAQGETTVTGKIQSRDHTERMLPHFGAQLKSKSDSICVTSQGELRGAQVDVPGDFSSAAFWLAAGAFLNNANVELTGVSLNATRTGFLQVLRRMGADIKVEVETQLPEPVGSIQIRSSHLKGTTVEADEVPSLVDEIPMLAVCATFAQGVTVVSGAEELRVKESDRIETVATNLRAMGIEIETRPDGFVIEGPQPLKGATVDSYHDHRIAMAFSMAALGAEGSTVIRNSECVNISYPTFFEDLFRIIGS